MKYKEVSFEEIRVKRFYKKNKLKKIVKFCFRNYNSDVGT